MFDIGPISRKYCIYKITTKTKPLLVAHNKTMYLLLNSQNTVN